MIPIQEMWTTTTHRGLIGVLIFGQVPIRGEAMALCGATHRALHPALGDETFVLGTWANPICSGAISLIPVPKVKKGWRANLLNLSKGSYPLRRRKTSNGSRHGLVGKCNLILVVGKCSKTGVSLKVKNGRRDWAGYKSVVAVVIESVFTNNLATGVDSECIGSRSRRDAKRNVLTPVKSECKVSR